MPDSLDLQSRLLHTEAPHSCVLSPLLFTQTEHRVEHKLKSAAQRHPQKPRSWMWSSLFTLMELSQLESGLHQSEQLHVCQFRKLTKARTKTAHCRCDNDSSLCRLCLLPLNKATGAGDTHEFPGHTPERYWNTARTLLPTGMHCHTIRPQRSYFPQPVQQFLKK